MDVMNAKQLLYEKFPNRRPVSVVDFKDFFVFNTVSKTAKNEFDVGGLLAVCKSTSEIWNVNLMSDTFKGYFEYAKNNTMKVV